MCKNDKLIIFTNDGLEDYRLEDAISIADVIFAFSITFMAISIQIPDIPGNNIISLKQRSLRNY